MQSTEPTEQRERPSQIHTVNTLAAHEPALNHGGIRWIIFQHKNDLLKDGAIFFIGKKLVIDRDLFIAFLKAQGGKA